VGPNLTDVRRRSVTRIVGPNLTDVRRRSVTGIVGPNAARRMDDCPRLSPACDILYRQRPCDGPIPTQKSYRISGDAELRQLILCTIERARVLTPCKLKRTRWLVKEHFDVRNVWPIYRML
jgi:hypothetical protein